MASFYTRSDVSDFHDNAVFSERVNFLGYAVPVGAASQVCFIDLRSFYNPGGDIFAPN